MAVEGNKVRRYRCIIISLVFLGLLEWGNTAFPQNPICDIKINGSDKPVTLHQSDTLTITIVLDNNEQTDNADWWLAAETPFGLYFFTFEGWTTEWKPGYQGPLFHLDSYEVLNTPLSGLPAGTYTIYFGVDTVMDGNVTWNSLYYKEVVFNIETTQGPIKVLFAVHVEPFLPEFGFDYGARREEMYWLRDLALTHGAKLTVASNGEFMEFVEDFGDQELVQSYLDAGFNWGTHIHPLWREGRHDWILESPDASEDLVRRIWQDNVNAVNSVIGTENNYGVAPYQCAQPLLAKMMREYGFTIQTALTEPAGIMAWENLGHYPWNPFRPSAETGKFLKEDLKQTQYILIPHYPQLEPNPGPSGPRSLGTNQKNFLMEYIEWLHWQRNGLPTKVWVFGIATHDCYNNPNRDDIETMLEWLDENFIGKTTPTGEIIAEYATATEIAKEFYQWETEHPHESSFSWEEGQPYPYTYSDMPNLLREAEYDTVIDLENTLACYRFTRENASPIYVLWSWVGEQVIDFSSQIPDQVRVYDGKGNEYISASGTLKVTEEPIFVEAN